MISSIHPKRFAGGIHPESEGKELSARTADPDSASA